MGITKVQDIDALYKKCGVKNNNGTIRTTINQGILNNKLNTNTVTSFAFAANKNLAKTK